VVAVPDPIVARVIVETAHQANPRLPIVARTYSAQERAFLERLGATEVVIGEIELGVEMARYVLGRFDVSARELDMIIQGLRRR